MALTGNKGEWSEIYTLLKLLGEGKVYAGDQNLNKIQDLFYPIIMILRQEKDGNYNYRLQDKDVVIQTPQVRNCCVFLRRYSLSKQRIC